MKMRFSVPVPRSGDRASPRALWTRASGFRLGDGRGDPPRLGVFNRDRAAVVVGAWHDAGSGPLPGWRACFRIEDMEGFAVEPCERDMLAEDPKDAVYGTREKTLRDPEGDGPRFGRDSG